MADKYHYRYIIMYNDLIKYIDEIPHINDKYRYVISECLTNKTDAQIAKELNYSHSRIPAMYCQYLKWCKELTGLVFFPDMPPISNDEYMAFLSKHRGISISQKEALLKKERGY